MNIAEFDWWRTNSKTLSQIAMMQREGRTFATADGSVQLYGQRVSPALFTMRGVQPLLGRGLLPDDERPDTDVVVLGEAMWRDYFNSAPDIVGQQDRARQPRLTRSSASCRRPSARRRSGPRSSRRPPHRVSSFPARAGAARRRRLARDGERGGQHAGVAAARHRAGARRRRRASRSCARSTS